MVKYVCLKVVLLGIIFSTLPFSGYAQENAQGTQRSPGRTPPYVPNSIPNTTNSQRASDRTPESANRNADPVMQAVQINVAEIEAGKMAAKKAQNPRVKEFANVMVKA